MNTSLQILRQLLDKCGKHEKLIKQIHAQAITLALLPNHQNLTCKLLNTYAKLAKPIEAQSIFNQIPNPDIVSWTCLISLYLKTERPSKAFSVFSQFISSSGLNPDGYSVVGALSACGYSKNLVGGKIVHGIVFRFGLGAEIVVGNALIDMYSRNERINLAQRVFVVMESKDVASWTSLLNGFVMCDDIVSATHLFDEMPQRNIISWTAMIVGHIRCKNAILALQLFREMISEGHVSPTSITVVAILSGCADIGALDFGGSIHGYVYKLPGFVSDVAVNNALIDMYSKGGCLEFAIRIFSEMNHKDAFSWTSLISGLALHGEGKSALGVFDNMLESGLVPNEVTLVSVLSACGHAGLITDGQRLFNQLIACYGIRPKIKHYGCMVDLLGRAGRLDEALELIERMPMKPDAVIWRSLLSACLARKNLMLAEMAGKKVLELEPNDDGVHVLLWNIYRSANKWDDAVKTRKNMRRQNIKKKPGCSWIELNGIVHEFTADGTIHNVAPDINSILEILSDQMSLAY